MAEETNYTISELNTKNVPKLLYLGTFFISADLQIAFKSNIKMLSNEFIITHVKLPRFFWFTDNFKRFFCNI